MPSAYGIDSIGGELSYVPFCTYPIFIRLVGSGDLTLHNGTCCFQPWSDTQHVSPGFPYPMIVNPVHFQQPWCELHAENNGNTFMTGAKWNLIAVLETKAQNSDEQYGLAIYLGLWRFNSNNPSQLAYGMRAELIRMRDNFVVQSFPYQNNPQYAQQKSSGQDGVVISLAISEWVPTGSELPHQYLSFNLASNTASGDNYFYYNQGGIAFDMTDPSVWLPSGYYIPDIFDYDPNKKGGNSGEGGGGGDHDDTGDKIEEGDITELEGITATNAGFVTLYKITMAQLQTLADEIYSDNIWQIVKNWWNKPNDMIAGLMLLPITPAGGTVYKPKVGTHTFNVSLPIVAKQYKEVDCGSLYIKEYYGGALDYSPYTHIQIYLPFIGLKELDVDEVMGKWLYVKYRIDVYNGDCIAFVKVGDGTAGSASIRYTFSGNCGQQIPTSGADFSAVINGCIQFATVAVASIISAGAAGAAAGAAGSAAAETGAVAAESAATAAQSVQAAANLKAAGDIGAAGVNAVMNGKPRVDRAGSIGCSLGQMGVLAPFIILTIPRQSLPAGYNKFHGYPANISGTIGSFSGYTVIDTVKLQGIPGTDGEIAEIEHILKGGVIL